MQNRDRRIEKSDCDRRIVCMCVTIPLKLTHLFILANHYSGKTVLFIGDLLCGTSNTIKYNTPNTYINTIYIYIYPNHKIYIPVFFRMHISAFLFCQILKRCHHEQISLIQLIEYIIQHCGKLSSGEILNTGLKSIPVFKWPFL